jgi:UDP-GlcNAc:undecaprenyl-phosphate GlcNAc-1-phosphate transferase
MTVIAAFAMSLLIAALLTPRLRRLAERRGLFDHPNDARKIHRRVIPRIGGVAIIVAFYVPFVGLMLSEPTGQSAYPLLVGGILIGALGLYDDLRGAGAGLKFTVEFAVAAGLYYFGYRIEQISMPGGPLDLGLLAFPVTLLWIVGVINAMNLIDGLDGLAGGIALCAISTNLVLSWVRGEPVMVLSMASLAGAVAGFLFYNFNPASIFMGDTGALFLGYVLAVSAIQTHQKSSTAVSLLIPMLVLALPITDTALAMARRALSGRSMFTGDLDHIHHRLLNKGLSHRNTVLVLYVTSLLLAGVALSLSFANDAGMLWVLVALSLAAFLALRRLGYFRTDGSSLALRHRNGQLRAAVDEIASRLRDAASVAEVLQAAETLGPAVSADEIRLELTGAPQEPSANGHAQDFVHASFELPEDLGRLHLRWRNGHGGEIDRDYQRAAEVVCQKVGHALNRMTRNKAPG